MDNPHGDGGFTDDEKMQLGQQQAAMIQLQNVREQQLIMERQKEQELMEAQQQAMMLRSREAQQKEEELKRLQQIALMERQQEEQHKRPMAGPPMPPRPPMPPMGGPPQPPAPMGVPQVGTLPPVSRPQQMGGPQQQQMGGPPQPIGGPPQPMGGPPQQMGGPPHSMGGPPQQMGASQQIGGPPQQMAGPPQQMGGPPQQMSGPPQSMGGPPQQLSGPPQQMGGPPQQMRGPQEQMGGPPQQMRGPQEQMGGPPQQMRGPQEQIGGPPQQMGGPPQQMRGPQEQMGGPPQQMRGPQEQMGGPPQQMGGPPQQMGGPPQQMGGPPQQMGGPQGGPQQMRGPMDRMSGPPQQPQQLRGPREQMGGPPERLDNSQQGMGRPPIAGMPPPMSGPPRDQVPSLMQGMPPSSQAQGGGQFAPNTSQMQRPGVQSGPPQNQMAGRFGPPQQEQMGGPSPGGPHQTEMRGPAPQQGQPNQFGPGRGQQDEGRPPSLMQIDARPPQGGKEEKEEEQEEEEREEEFKLPPALEKVLGFKDARLQEVGVKPEEMERIEQGEIVEDEAAAAEMDELERRKQAMLQQQQVFDEEEEDEEEPGKETSKKESKNKKRKKKKKKAKQRHFEQNKYFVPQTSVLDDVEVEYVQEELQMDRSDPSYREFSKIFEAFKIAEPEKPKEEPKKEVKPDLPKEKPPKAFGEDSSGEESDKEEDKTEMEEEKTKMSKKKMKKLNRLSVAELKQLVTRPDVVEMHDVTARDPKLLVHLKATKNAVPVPRHWCFKRKYLQGKRGIEKMPFDLPDFIKNTGIMEMRQALQEKEDAKNLKAKMREKVRPKMGKIDIDYQKLHDAFFKYQTKPKMTIHGDLYYEGKEFETRLKEKKPGDLSDDIRTALGMPLGPNANKYPPPWLIAMQRYGPPPSYPNLKISGLNSPIPEGCSFGYHAGGWGKPPVDETGKPLYGDVFGQNLQDAPAPREEEEVDKALWGELESESEEEESEESESEDEREVDADASGLVTPGDPGLITPSGVTSVPVGVETPDMIELRKKRIEDAMDQGGDTPALYQVLKEKSAAVGGSMMGSAHVYDMQAGKKAGENAEGVEVALNPDELDLDTAAIQAKYDQQMRESQLEKEDLSDMVADHAARQAKKRKKQQQQDSKSAKKYKEFKF